MRWNRVANGAEGAYLKWVLALPDLSGSRVRIRVHLINDSWHDARVHVDLLLTRECPEFIPEAECLRRPVSRWAYDFVLKADSIEKVPVTWKLPAEEGCYWLTARLAGVKGRPVVSQRFVRAFDPVVVPEAVKQRTFVVLGTSEAARTFFTSNGLRTSDQLDHLSPNQHVVVIWNATHLTEAEKRTASLLCEFASRGGRVVVLSIPSWDWLELCELKVRHDPRFSRVFPYDGIKSPLLEGVDPRWLIRWNGMPGTVASGSLEGPSLDRAEKILWAREPKTTVMALVPAASGGGRILFSQLDLQRRVDRSSPSYDPVAERVLLDVLSRQQW